MLSVLLLLPLVLGLSYDQTPMTVNNHAGAPIELWWVNTFSPRRELVLQSPKPVRNASSIHINSYDSHEFMVKFYNRNDTIEGHFIKGPQEEEVDVYYDEMTNQLRVKVSSDFDDWVDVLDAATSRCMNNKSKKFSECLAEDVYKKVSKQEQEHQDVLHSRDSMAFKLRNYTCADPNIETSKPINSFPYTFDGKTYKIDTMFEIPSTKIWATQDFVTDEECAIFRSHAEGNLYRATVAGDDGHSEYSSHRRAQQAHYDLPIDNPETDPLWPLYSRIMNFLNTHGHFHFVHAGQEDFTIIQYNPTDEYFPRECSNFNH